MYSVTRLIDIAEQDRDRMAAALRRAASDAGALHWVAGPTLGASRGVV